MSFIKSILLHIDASERTAERVAVAAALAERHGATVNATYAVTSTTKVPAVASLEMGGPLHDDWRDFDELRWLQARERFIACNVGPRFAFHRLDEAAPLSAFVRRAFTADLLVLGQNDRSARDSQGTPADFVESVVMDSGRPAIVVPCAGPFTDVGKAILVAWKSSRESARALTAALPFLRLAREVHVASWGGEPREVEPLLLCHGVKARYHREGDAPRALGESVLSRAADYGADLLVMGCYSRGRTTEWVLGGVSRTLLASMTVPVLLAH